MDNTLNKQLKGVGAAHIVRAISEMLITLGNSIKKADQIFIWRNYYQEHRGSLLYKEQIFEWNKENISPDCSNVVHKLEEVIMPPVLETDMLQDIVVHGPTKYMADLYSKALLEENGVLSSLLVAIFVAGKLWGCLSLDNCTTEEEWSEEEITIVRKYSKRLGEYIEHSKLYAINNN